MNYWHEYVISNVAIAALVLLKYQVISIQSADCVFIIYDQFQTQLFH